MNVAELSLDELLALQNEVRQGLEKQKDNAIAEIVAKMKAMNIAVTDLTLDSNPHSGKGKYKRVPKYRNPANPDEVWGGVGKMPKWFKAQLDKGVDKDDMLIPS